MNRASNLCSVAATLLAACVAAATYAATLGVPSPYPTIQAAINAAVSGADTVLVAPGTYPETIDFKGKNIEVRSSGGAGVTFIDGGGTGRVVSLKTSEGPGAILSGFTLVGNGGSSGPRAAIYCYYASPTIIGCTATGSYQNGIYCEGGAPRIESCVVGCNTGMYTPRAGIYGYLSSPTIVGCTASGCISHGIRFDGGSPRLEGCTVRNNSWEGGIYLYGSSALVTNCTVEKNIGGGIRCETYCSPTVDTCTVCGNTNTGGGWGNGIVVRQWSHAFIRNSIIVSNVAQANGGGVYINESWGIISNCTVAGNRAPSGGGLCFTYYATSVVANCLIAGNLANVFGGGVFCEYSSPRLLNCTLAANRANLGCEMFVSQRTSTPVVVNSILWGSQTNEIYLSNDATVKVSYCDAQGGWGGISNLNVDPLFVSPVTFSNAPTTAGDYHLQMGGPCIDVGTNLPSVGTDRDGVTRPLDGNLDLVARWDLGAYEVILPWADTDQDGMDDLWEFQRFGNATAGVPYVDTDGDSVTNNDEYAADTDPLSGADFFRVTAVTNWDARYIRFLSSTGRVYTLQVMTDTTAWKTWSDLPPETNRPGLGGAMSLRDPASAASRAYRVRVWKP